MSAWVSSKQKHRGRSQDWTLKINIFQESSVDFSELFAWAKGMLSHWGLFSLFRKLIMWFKIAFKRWPIWHSIFFHQQHVQKCCAGLDLLVQIDEWEICCSVISCILLDRKQLFKNSKLFRLVKKKVRQNIYSHLSSHLNLLSWESEHIFCCSKAMAVSLISRACQATDLLMTVASICWL